MPTPDRTVTVHVTSDDRATPQCDFCGEPWPCMLFPCEAFTVAAICLDDQAESLEQDFNGDGWAACVACAPLAAAGDVDGLVARFKQVRPGVDDYTVVRVAFATYLTHRYGQPIPYLPGTTPPPPPPPPRRGPRADPLPPGTL